LPEIFDSASTMVSRSSMYFSLVASASVSARLCALSRLPRSTPASVAPDVAAPSAAPEMALIAPSSSE
jgi:hypothetical protein